MSAAPDPDWLLMEKTVALLEKAMAPNAEVRHNERLPVLGDPESTRQCDVTIRTGKPPRQTLTIVEVQKREDKPELVMFHGWHKKMTEVGAQHLICVSAVGFPNSIIQRVFKEYGPTVHLMKLADLDAPKIPGFNFLHDDILRHVPTFTINSVSAAIVRAQSGELQVTFKGADKVFDAGSGVPVISFDDMMRTVLERRDAGLNIPPELRPNPELLDLDLFSIFGPELWVSLPEGRFKLRALAAGVRIDHRWRRIPLKYSEYRQVEIDNAVAWLANAKGEGEDAAFSCEVVFTLDENNALEILVRTSDPGLRMSLSTDRDLLAKVFAPIEQNTLPPSG